MLPSGIEASDHPLLGARSAAYVRSFTLHVGENAEKQPSAVTAQDVLAKVNHDRASGTLLGSIPAAALVDGRDAPSHAVHRRWHGDPVVRHNELLVSIHQPLGIAILVLVVVRLVNRWINPPPALPDTVRPLRRVAVKASHILLYALMLAMLLVG